MPQKLPPVYIYAARQPMKSGSGDIMRFYSNARAYLDLGYPLETVQIHLDAEAAGRPAQDLDGIRHETRTVGPASPPRIPSRLLYRTGVVHPWSVAYYFPLYDAVRAAVLERERRTPGAIHQIEGDSHSGVIPFLPRLRVLLGHHDIYSDTVRFVQEIACEREGRSELTAAERRERRFVENLERRVAGRADAILCGSLRDRDVIRGWGTQTAEYLPCSTFEETVYRRFEGPRTGPLRLVHIGRINHLPTFRSLEFLLTRVWPHLPADLRNRIQLRIIGKMTVGQPLCDRVRELAAPFPEIQFTGFVADLAPELEAADAHIVLATAATGYRTRIIESFASGVPVLSNATAADGLEGLRPGENILIASEPGEVITALEGLLGNADALSKLSLEGIHTYRNHYSRRVVAERLDRILKKTYPDLTT